jgi:hypothetical protein
VSLLHPRTACAQEPVSAEASASSAQQGGWGEQRATLLADALADRSRLGAGPSAGWVIGAIGVAFAAGTGVVGVAYDADAGTIAVAALPGATMAMAGFGSELVDEDYYQTTLRAGLLYATAAGFGSLAFVMDEPHAALWVAAGAEFVQGSLLVLDAFVRRPISRQKLAVTDKSCSGELGPALTS